MKFPLITTYSFFNCHSGCRSNMSPNIAFLWAIGYCWKWGASRFEIFWWCMANEVKVFHFSGQILFWTCIIKTFCLTFTFIASVSLKKNIVYETYQQCRCLDQSDLLDWTVWELAMLMQHFSHSTDPGQNHEFVQNKVYHLLHLLPLLHPLSDSKHPDGRES